MQVLLTTDRAGITWMQHEGDLVDLPRDEAELLIAAGHAIAAKSDLTLKNNPAGEASSEPAFSSHNKQRTRRR